jgi:hypothetical protein
MSDHSPRRSGKASHHGCGAADRAHLLVIHGEFTFLRAVAAKVQSDDFLSALSAPS